MSSPTNIRFAVAYHALSLLASIPGEPLSSEQMATSVGSSPVYLRRVLGLLRRAGFVESRPGIRGGWSLARSSAAISLGDVWRAVQGEEPVLGIHGPPPDCPVGSSVSARLAEVEQRVARAIEASLDELTIADTVPDGAPFSADILTVPAEAAGGRLGAR
ncbi:Rrf2 family transcriptional regulator [Planotetraspora thailandica]|uniref:Rrf2 family transcriptional regulator n=1 Tax=Planotetraspora thailandica TaxID=487172 RepID=A0A8J3XTW6_9ACTN|nr:Rrf2 family transcriptional regulator [Planotetraspora thailandica]GII52594.1 Rrf2 family transcriptional regulator [Planotetraspora thailandica]